MRTLIYLLLLTTTAVMAAPLSFAPSIEPAVTAPVEDKAVRIRERDSVLEFAVEPEKSEYQVNESIRFRVRADKQFYLYVVNLDEQNSTAELLVPSSAQRANRYTAGGWHVVPNKDFDFTDDRPGQKHLVFIASRNSLNIDKTDLHKLLGTDQSAGAKGLWFNDASAHPEQDAVVSHIKLKINDKAPPSAGHDQVPDQGARTGEGHNESLTFLSVDRKQYRPGDIIQGLYGANKPGFVHVFVIAPKGQHELLHEGPVAPGKTQVFQAEATKPLGAHKLVAVYSEQKTLDESRIDFGDSPGPAAERNEGKGVRVISGKRAPETFVSFSINE